MPFDTTVAGDVFSSQARPMLLSNKECDCNTNDIMIVGKRTNHSNHNQELATLLDTARKCNVLLNYEKL